jgi:hypothetical protein
VTYSAVKVRRLSRPAPSYTPPPPTSYIHHSMQATTTQEGHPGVQDVGGWWG